MVQPNGLVAHPEPAPLPFGPSTLADILAEGVANHPDRLALIDGHFTWTYAELDEQVAELAESWLKDRSVFNAFWVLGSPTSAVFVISHLAQWRMGRLWVAGKTKPDMSEPEKLADSVAGASINPGDPAVVAFTSGTTGEPKRVVHSHRSMLLPAAVSAHVEPAQDGERIGTPLDLRIANVMILGPLSAFIRGSTFVFMGDTTAAAMADDIERHGITRLITVPTLAHDLVTSLDISSSQLVSLDRVILGGSGARPEMLQSFTDRFGVRPTLSYGLSEAPTGVVRESLGDPIGSGKGHPLPHVEIVVCDPESGEPRDVGEIGEICVKAVSSGPWAKCWTGTLGYLGQPDLTEKLFRGGVMHTGDLGFIDAEGRVSVTGRMTDMIVRGGLNVDPNAIRDALLADASVLDAHVVGYPDERLGQAIGAVVVLDHAETVDQSELLERLRAHCAPSPGPDQVVVVDEIPRNQLGKPDRSIAEQFPGGGV